MLAAIFSINPNSWVEACSQQLGLLNDNQTEDGPGLITEATLYACSSTLRIMFFHFITERIKWHNAIMLPKC